MCLQPFGAVVNKQVAPSQPRRPADPSMTAFQSVRDSEWRTGHPTDPVWGFLDLRPLSPLRGVAGAVG